MNTNVKGCEVSVAFMISTTGLRNMYAYALDSLAGKGGGGNDMRGSQTKCQSLLPSMSWLQKALLFRV